MLKVRVANDDTTPMEFVVLVLEEIFEKSRDEAMKIMLEAHRDGQAVCGVYTEARARDWPVRQFVAAQREGHALQFSVAPSASN
jgi:ATP-dependent Clp protease adaptor protein ClpS